MGYAPIQGTRAPGIASLRVVTGNGNFNLPNGVTEVDLLEFLQSDDKITVSMDFINIAEKIRIRIKEKVDGTNYRLAQASLFPDDFDGPQVNLTLDGKGRDLKLTLQSLTAEGSIKIIPHARVEEIRII